MPESRVPRRKGILGPSSVLMLLIFPLGDLPSANGACEFPASWAGEWYQYGNFISVAINATHLGERTCVEKSEDTYIVYGSTDGCYHCMIINARHENVIQYREGWCSVTHSSLEDICSNIKSDDALYSMFRMNSKPIACPFSGASFTFTYNKGYRECVMPISLAERCTDESKILLKYQACPDVYDTESNTEELQCLAVWNDGRNKYLVGTLKERSSLGSGKTYRCFLYEEKTHHQGRVVYLLAQSGDPTCNGLTTVSEGSPTIKLTKVDKEHNRCKYPSWVTEHHDWHSLDDNKVYHFTNKNATLKVKVHEGDGDAYHEEKIVCHNLEKLYPNDNMQGNTVKLIAHVTSGCDIGYVCMIFHRRDSHVIELQQSDEKAVMPDEACSQWDPSTMPHTTLITTVLHRRKCPNPGRYTILGSGSSHPSGASRRYPRSDKTPKSSGRRTWQENSEDEQRPRGKTEEEELGENEEECRKTDVKVGCTTAEQNEMIIGNTCDHEQMSYLCHGSWEERGTWYTIVSQSTAQDASGGTDGSAGGGSGSVSGAGGSVGGVRGETFCFSMRMGSTAEKPTGKSTRIRLLEQELWLSRPERSCRREPTLSDDRTYRLTNQGVCEDLTKAASSLASVFSFSRILLSSIVGSYAVYIQLFR